jgi:hypothetical protein
MLVALTSLMATGCDLFPTQPQPLDGGIVFAVREIHGLTHTRVGVPDIVLEIETEASYPSISYQLRGDIRMRDGEIRAAISGVEPCTACADAVGPARRRVVLPLAEGEYPLRFSYGGRTDRYLVAVTPEAIEIRVEAAAFTTSRFAHFWRFPPNSFAYICNAGRHGPACDEFGAILRTSLELQPLVFPPDGVVPYPDGAYYRYASWTDFEAAGDLLRAFIAERPGLQLKLMNWMNEQYRSWLDGS